MIDLSGKNITVLGLSRSGTSSAKLLVKKNANVFISEYKDSPEARENLREIDSAKVKFELGKHSPEFIKNKDFIVISPGIADTAKPVVWAKEFNVPIVSEIELAFWFCPAKIIAITGSNGKTTVTTLVSKVLEAAGSNSYLLGNIGRPFCEDVLKLGAGDFVSLEVSSFQLEKIKNFKPYIAAILNIAINHMDRHKTLEEYLASKKRIFMNQDKTDWAILNFKDKYLSNLEGEIKSKIVYFNKDTANPINPNFSCVLEIANVLGIKKEIAMQVLSEFKGLPHRTEEVRIMGGIKFINDSKSTNVTSTIWALNLVRQPVILIAGGRDKGDDFSVLNRFDNRIKKIILFGEAKDKIASAIDESKISKACAGSMEEAINIAIGSAASGDCVLFSPMCTSFDMFKNYEHRGDVFREYVKHL